MEDRLHTATAEIADALHSRLRVLSRRATLINRAIALCVLCGLLVSLVVVALLSLAAALLLLLREVFLATSTLTFGGTHRPTDNAAG